MADKFAVETAMAQAVALLADDFQEAAMVRFDQANGMIDAGDIKEGLAELQRLTVLRKLGIAKVAAQRMTEVRRDPEVRAAMIEANAEVLYQRALELLWSAPSVPDDECLVYGLCPECRAALAADSDSIEMSDEVAAIDDVPAEVSAAWNLKPPEQLDLFEILEEVMQRFPETVSAMEAQWMLEALQSDDVLVQAVERTRTETNAAELLQLALNYLANDKVNEARIELSRVVQDFPETEAARHAEATLATLDGQE